MNNAQRTAAALAAAAGLAACGAPAPQDLTVFGAASTRVLNQDLQALSGPELVFVNAGSADLLQQLAAGAPGDVLITADAATMDRAVAAGVAEHPRVVATNTLVLVVPKGNPAGIARVEDAAGPGVSLVICDAQVPCGSATRTLAAANNLQLNPVSLEHSVTDTLGKVVSGEADAGFVYATDAAAAGGAVEVIEIPHAAEHRNELVAAIATTTDDRAAAEAFVELLLSDAARNIWSSHGFTPAD